MPRRPWYFGLMERYGHCPSLLDFAAAIRAPASAVATAMAMD
jgi:hypothetical protein